MSLTVSGIAPGQQAREPVQPAVSVCARLCCGRVCARVYNYACSHLLYKVGRPAWLMSGIKSHLQLDFSLSPSWGQHGEFVMTRAGSATGIPRLAQGWSSGGGLPWYL